MTCRALDDAVYSRRRRRLVDAASQENSEIICSGQLRLFKPGVRLADSSEGPLFFSGVRPVR